ncbi:MAG: flagellar biosynthetic protein FliO [Clostridiales Family XIII bacterium]|nr:flagellar biosynthetic protein FliO [Clostridiales Family XIII bacterium]
MLGDIWSIILALIGITLVLALTYFVSKWYAGRIGHTASGQHIKVVDRIVVGKNSSIIVIELGEAQYMIGVTEQGVSIMKELDEPAKIVAEPKTPDFEFKLLNLRDFNFRNVLDKYNKRKGGGL